MYTARRVVLALLMAILVASLTVVPGFAASRRWMNFWGTVFSDDHPLAGAAITAYVGGMAMGEATSQANGFYGILAIFGDDPTTPQKDGAVQGDVVVFFVDGVQAGAATWSAPGGLLVNLYVGTGRLPDTTESCQDSYEYDDLTEKSFILTGPEYHTFFRDNGSADVDWGSFVTTAAWIYQIKAHAGQSFVTDPYLRLYNSGGTQLAENDNYWGKDAEIWWWNNGPDQTFYIQVREAHDATGCHLGYTLEVVPWSPGEFQLTFGPN